MKHIVATALTVISMVLGATSTDALLTSSPRMQQSFKASSSATTWRLFANSKNIRAAMEVTEQYGIDSPEARLAWEVVEEFDARTNDSAAYTPNEANQLSQEQMQNAYAELQYTLQMMERRKMAFQQNDQLMKDVAAELQAIKLSPPTKKPAPQIPGLWDAKLKARAFSQQFGNASPEAKLAWEEVEEIASAGLENAIGDGLSEETCDLGQAAECFMALEELDQFLYVENQYYHDTENDNYHSKDGDTYYQQNNDNYQDYQQY